MKYTVLEAARNFASEQYHLAMLYKLPELKRSIKDNRKFKDAYKGKRCFILGNGPSLKSIDLELFGEEFVFTVNNFTSVDGYEKAKTNVHLWTDPCLFGISSDPNEKQIQKNFMDNCRKVAKMQPVCFVPFSAYQYVKKHRLDQLLDIHYLLITKTFVGCRMHNIDLCKSIYGCTTVVQFAIQVAIYMGFGEIYLLGCDSTNIFTMLEAILGMDDKDRHAYSVDENKDKAMRKRWIQHVKTSEILYGQYLLFEGYNRLSQYCARHGIRIKNASTSTLVTGIDKVDINKILKRQCNKTDDIYERKE